MALLTRVAAEELAAVSRLEALALGRAGGSAEAAAGSAALPEKGVRAPLRRADLEAARGALGAIVRAHAAREQGGEFGATRWMGTSGAAPLAVN
jgi:hypothetical protein